jgi:zinc D-Ala-D-Ala carboxypeptidase
MSYFTESELSCKCCGENKFNDETLVKLNVLREKCGFPFIVTSGYRCEAYNNKIGATQTHATGQAADIQISGTKAAMLIKHLQGSGFTGLGISQKGPHQSRFIHLDDLPNSVKRPRPWVWSY